MTPIPFTTHYFADTLGNIYSTKGGRRFMKDRDIPILLTPQTQRNGYNTVNIVFKGKRKTMLIGYLILLTFVSDRPNKNYQCCHGKNGKNDNSLNNLSWKTTSQNNKEDKERDNTDMLGEKHFRSLFKNSDIPIIRQLHKQGKSNKEIAIIYNSHHSTISKIIRGHTWSHI